jgi:hypothetical protein
MIATNYESLIVVEPQKRAVLAKLLLVSLFITIAITGGGLVFSLLKETKLSTFAQTSVKSTSIVFPEISGTFGENNEWEIATIQPIFEEIRIVGSKAYLIAHYKDTLNTRRQEKFLLIYNLNDNTTNKVWVKQGNSGVFKDVKQLEGLLKPNSRIRIDYLSKIPQSNKSNLRNTSYCKKQRRICSLVLAADTYRVFSISQEIVE